MENTIEKNGSIYFFLHATQINSSHAQCKNHSKCSDSGSGLISSQNTLADINEMKGKDIIKGNKIVDKSSD